MKKVLNKKIITSIFTFFLVFTSVNSVQAEVDPKIKALGTLAAYGTIGGALLGTASLAFGAGGRSVAKGASLGLYAGLLFGGYIVLTHQMRKNRGYENKSEENYYPDADDSSPYESSIDWGNGKTLVSQNSFAALEETSFYSNKKDHYSGPSQKVDLPLYYMNLVHYTF